MSFEITGRLAEKFSTQQISDKFQKREFILEIKETGSGGFEFVEYIKFQAVQDKCALLDSLQTDDMVKVSFNLKGRKWEKDGKVSYFTNLDAWKVEKEQSIKQSPSTPGNHTAFPPNNSAPFPDEPPFLQESGFDDLPF